MIILRYNESGVPGKKKNSLEPYLSGSRMINDDRYRRERIKRARTVYICDATAVHYLSCAVAPGRLRQSHRRVAYFTQWSSIPIEQQIHYVARSSVVADKSDNRHRVALYLNPSKLSFVSLTMHSPRLVSRRLL